MDGKSHILTERRRQIEEEGWTPEHDEQHEVEHLAAAAAAYVLAQGPGAEVPKGWPWGREWWKPKDRLRNLVRAGALYLAASDLADRRGLARRAASLREQAELCARQIDRDADRVLRPEDVLSDPLGHDYPDASTVPGVGEVGHVH